ncbi:MAG: peptidoglycan-binding domain-containing protein [Amphritea sp.]
MNKHLAIFATSALSLAVLSGCSTTHPQRDVTRTPEYQALERELAETKNADARNAELESEIARLQNQDSSLLPPNPKPGECYARVVIPAKYQTISETVQTIAPSERIDVTPPEYQWVEKRVVHTEASTRLEVIPATYKDVTETIQVSDPSERLERVLATYKTVTERILVSPARTEWKKGTGPIQRLDESTGEIMCLVEVPAQYRTVTKRVVDTPESIRRIAIPGKNKTITRHVVDRAATTREIKIPETYKTVRVRQLVKPATQNVVAIPGKIDTITKRTKTADSYLEWRSILCETNTTPDLISRLQTALNDKSYNPGPIDGVYGVETQGAVSRYQKAQGLATGQLTIDTLRKLGVH